MMKHHDLNPGTIPRSRALRRDATPAERRLWLGLREAFPDAHFRRQVPLGPYFADFASHRCKLVIEVDGDSHAHSGERDAVRTEFLKAQGYRVIRFWNNDVMNSPEGVLDRIGHHISPTPRPPHKGEGAIGQPLVGVY